MFSPFERRNYSVVTFFFLVAQFTTPENPVVTAVELDFRCFLCRTVDTRPAHCRQELYFINPSKYKTSCNLWPPTRSNNLSANRSFLSSYLPPILVCTIFLSQSYKKNLRTGPHVKCVAFFYCGMYFDRNKTGGEDTSACFCSVHTELRFLGMSPLTGRDQDPSPIQSSSSSPHTNTGTICTLGGQTL